MIKLSDIIKTNCYIDCGTNEKLREVVKVLPKSMADLVQEALGIVDDECFIRIRNGEYFTKDTVYTSHPILHISTIDLNA